MNLRFTCGGYVRGTVAVPGEAIEQLYEAALEAGPSWPDSFDFAGFVGRLAGSVPGNPSTAGLTTVKSITLSGVLQTIYPSNPKVFEDADIFLTGEWQKDWVTATFMAAAVFGDMVSLLPLIVDPPDQRLDRLFFPARGQVVSFVQGAQALAFVPLQQLYFCYDGKAGRFIDHYLWLLSESVQELFDKWMQLPLTHELAWGIGDADVLLARVADLLERLQFLVLYLRDAVSEDPRPPFTFLEVWRWFFELPIVIEAIFPQNWAQIFDTYKRATGQGSV